MTSTLLLKNYLIKIMDSKPIKYRNTFIKTLINTTKMPFLKIRIFKDLFP